MTRFVSVTLDSRGVSCVARLLDDEAPRTCAAVWDALPLQGITTITHSSGEVLHFWCSVPEPVQGPSLTPRIVPVEHRGQQVGVIFLLYQATNREPNEAVPKV